MIWSGTWFGLAGLVGQARFMLEEEASHSLGLPASPRTVWAQIKYQRGGVGQETHTHTRTAPVSPCAIGAYLRLFLRQSQHDRSRGMDWGRQRAVGERKEKHLCRISFIGSVYGDFLFFFIFSSTRITELFFLCSLSTAHS
jgi:hypothetical protein